MKIWYVEIKKDHIISSQKGLNKIPLQISYLETVESILRDGFRKNFFKVITYPFCSKKLKLIIALLLPKFVLKKIRTY